MSWWELLGALAVGFGLGYGIAGSRAAARLGRVRQAVEAYMKADEEMRAGMARYRRVPVPHRESDADLEC